jgi:cystathionine beta-lyase
VKLVEPEGTYLLWLDFREYNLSNDELKEILVKKAGIGFNAGEMFGDEGSGFQRMNIACPSQMVTFALNQLKDAFGDL